ncbi:hypothetical protein Q9L58_004374 [Maublancomyces gigas]|uniref:Uncharacterized protein n=1 Tax=Discina gigas TaxID=1032678 RepID=A0ABR3GL43_9PEZI
MDSPDPFTPGFAQFQGIPDRTLPDDCMGYALFVIDSPDARARLADVKREAEELAAAWSRGYIWQREGFSLELVEKPAEKTWCLQGRTEYGDSVDDEWFIVWMLRELSKGLTDLWIRIYDTDGEFLLIEAANALPRWLNPEISDHRVWLNSGRLLIIPLSAAAPTTPATSSRTQPVSRTLSLSEALSLLRSGAHDPRHLTHIRLVEEEAFYRTTSYPAAALTHLHHTSTVLPRTIAHLLHTHPSTVSAAVEAFYLRDTVSLKALTTMTSFPPTDLVTVTTTLTRVLYAQLKCQEFAPPPSAGFHADSAINAVDIGTKLTCGFEMLLSDGGAPQLASAARRATVDVVRGFMAEGAPLPGDAVIAGWARREDGEDWLDVDYTAFEETLQGRPGHKGSQNESGWGDKGAEENLKRMVERFEAFLNDDEAGVEGAELADEMDNDDDDDDDDDEGEDEDEDEDEEDKEVSFDEKEFEVMMREMMGMPSSTLDADADAGEGEEVEIRKMMDRVEAELRDAGALTTGVGSGPTQRIKDVVDHEDGGQDDDGDSDADVDIDFTLAANMLESFKGQGGMAGPGGNLLARMGIVLPRDDPRGEYEEKGKGKGKGKAIS